MQAVDGENRQQGVVGENDEKISSGKHRGALFPAGVILLSAAVALAPFAYRSDGAAGFLILYVAALAGWLACARARFTPGTRTLILISLAVRLAPYAQVPELSHDVYRYLWDGKVSAAGINPYLHAPADGSLGFLREEWHGKINHPEIRTVYPPAAQAAFAFVAILSGGMWGWKTMLIVVDLAMILMIARLAGRRVALLYALFPLVIIEGMWSAHLDILSSFVLVAAVLALERDKNLKAGIAVGAAAMIKVLPLAAVPAVIAGSSRRSRLVTGFSLTILALIVPFAMHGAVMPGMRDYATRWSFNSPVYEATLHLVRSWNLPEAAKVLWTIIRDRAGLEMISAPVFSVLHAEMITRGLLAALLAVLLVAVVRASKDVPGAIATSTGLLLLVSPTLHPWYWLALIPFALMASSRIWIALAAASPLSYLLYEGADPMLVFALCYGIPAFAILCARLRDSSSAGANGMARWRRYFSSARA